MVLSVAESRYPGHNQYRQNAVHRISDIDYDTFEHTKLDVYEPPKALKVEKAPVILYIHGGAWHIGDKKHSRFPAEHMAHDGHVVVVPAYHLTTLSTQEYMGLLQFGIVICLLFVLCFRSAENRMAIMIMAMIFVTVFLVMMSFAPDNKIQHPQHIIDVANSLRWTIDNIDKYGGDPDKIVVMGHSAGAHLASLLATNHRFTDMFDIPRDTIKGTIAMSGVYNDKRLTESRLGDTILKRVFGDNAHFDAFPIYNIKHDETPPHLLLNASKDISLKRHAADYFFALRTKEVYAKSIEVPDTTHWSICRDWGPGEAHENVWTEVKEFIRQCLEYDRLKPMLFDYVTRRNASLHHVPERKQQETEQQVVVNKHG